MNSNSSNIFRNDIFRISSIIIGNIISYIPKGLFTGLLYFIIINITVPVLNGKDFDFNMLWKYYYIYLGAFFIFMIVYLAGQINNYVQSYTIGSDLRIKLGEKLKKLSLGFFKSNDPGDVTSRMLHDVNKAEENLSHHMPDLVSAFVVPVILGIFLFTIDKTLTSILFMFAAISMIFFTASRYIVTIYGKKHVASINRASSGVLEYVDNIKIIKSFNMTGKKFTRLDQFLKELKILSFKQEVYAGIPVQLAMMVLDTGYLYMVYAGINRVMTGLTDIPSFFAFAILGYHFFDPIKMLGVSIVILRYGSHSVDRIIEIFRTEELEYEEGRKLPDSNHIVFENVDFSYASQKVIDDVNISIPENTITALVGVSGSGKTTVTNLISRFWDIDSGRILWGGVDIRKIDPELLLKRISMVFQDVFLFNDTIINNIRTGNPKADDEEVIKAANLAQCHEFITALPEGYNTVLSEGGKNLSGGERQRISIARAILKDAPVILLDEATASLDPENENIIQKAIGNLVKDKTVIVIVHKYRSILKADQILVFEKGKVIESGKHKDLISRDNGTYRRLWNFQEKTGNWKITNRKNP